MQVNCYITLRLVFKTETPCDFNLPILEVPLFVPVGMNVYETIWSFFQWNVVGARVPDLNTISYMGDGTYVACVTLRKKNETDGGDTSRVNYALSCSNI